MLSKMQSLTLEISNFYTCKGKEKIEIMQSLEQRCSLVETL